MIRYIAMKHINCGARRGYDMLACEAEGDVLEVVAAAENVITDRAHATTLVKTLNGGDVDPLHMEDIIEDTLFEMAL